MDVIANFSMSSKRNEYSVRCRLHIVQNENDELVRKIEKEIRSSLGIRLE